jgi:hypothetical protein
MPHRCRRSCNKHSFQGDSELVQWIQREDEILTINTHDNVDEHTVMSVVQLVHGTNELN